MPVSLGRPPKSVMVVLIAVVLVLAAAALLPALSDERRLRSADGALTTSPARALSEAGTAVGPATRRRVTATAVAALIRLGDAAGAERLAAVAVRNHPDDALAVRRLYQVQVFRKRSAAASRTLRVLRRLDPRFANGTGV